MWVRVLGFSCVLVGEFEVLSYTFDAGVNLHLAMADRCERTFAEWIDIRDDRVTEEWGMQNPKRTGCS